MSTLIIFIAKYLFFVSAAIAIIFFLKQLRQKQKEMLIFAVILLPLSYVIAKIVSRFYFDPRPFVQGNFAPLIGHAADNGFPSDHTLLAAAIAFAIFHFNKKLGLFLFFLAVLVGVARVLAGVHHAADIAGSLIIVGLVYLLTDYFTRKKE
ncbi:MAG: phosphatase PAP2 family protein [Candidatus Moranbacteria bacterium]|nr:phosphatase PAP2 family protein [Candidatus Moranbacteria bacterium]